MTDDEQRPPFPCPSDAWPMEDNAGEIFLNVSNVAGVAYIKTEKV